MSVADSSKSFCIYLELEPYLRDWVVNDCGGSLPVRFPKLSIENIILKNFLMPLPPNAKPDIATVGKVPIEIPAFRLKNPEVYNYLPKGAKHELKFSIRERFKLDLWNCLFKFGWIGKKRADLIEAFMSSRCIEFNDKNMNSIIKIYQRQYKDYLKSKYQNKNQKKL